MTGLGFPFTSLSDCVQPFQENTDLCCWTCFFFRDVNNIFIFVCQLFGALTLFTVQCCAWFTGRVHTEFCMYLGSTCHYKKHEIPNKPVTGFHTTLLGVMLLNITAHLVQQYLQAFFVYLLSMKL